MPYTLSPTSLPIRPRLLSRMAYPALLAAMAFLSPPESLADPLSVENLAGFDGVVTHCISSTDKTFAVTMCNDLVEAAKKQAAAQALGHVHLGTVEWTAGGGAEPALPDDLDIAMPLHLAFYIRGTDGNPAGAVATAQFFVPHGAASEGGETSREGRLVIWQDATLGSGPPKATADSVSTAVSKKMTNVFEALGTARKSASD